MSFTASRLVDSAPARCASSGPPSESCLRVLTLTRVWSRIRGPSLPLCSPCVRAGRACRARAALRKTGGHIGKAILVLKGRAFRPADPLQSRCKTATVVRVEVG